MKITINIECTPEEARRFLGFPDVAPLQEALLKEVQDQMMGGLNSVKPAEMMTAWLPWLEMQKAFWSKMTTSEGEPDGSS
jgi:hypothetical protein